MGQNPCKHLVEGGRSISQQDLQRLLDNYDKDRNGALDFDETEQFLKDLCQALQTRYDKQNAVRIFSRCDQAQTGFLQIGEFVALFNEAIKEAEAMGSEQAKKLQTDSKGESPAQPPAAAVPVPAPVQQEQPKPQPQPEPEPELTPHQRRYNEAFAGSSRIDREEITLGKLIGKGQFGEVYISTCRGMECAVKIPNMVLGGAKFDMLLNELEIMKKANNPHVAMFMGACHDRKSDKILIVMELMAGDAEKKCKEPEHPLSLRLNWVRQACKGQAWLHGMSQPILHLDLKPSNILFDQRGLFKVCDFGLSAVLPEGEKTLFTNRMRGTPIYMAPEIMIPGQFPVSEKSDTYSMAITAWEMCTGKNCFSEYRSLPPFKHDVHRMGKRPAMPESWPESLVTLMNQMWAPNPLQRPSLADVVSRLDAIIPEVERLEFQAKLLEQVQNREGAEWWAAKFPGKLKVAWNDFYPVFFAHVGENVSQNAEIEHSADGSAPSEERQKLLCLKGLIGVSKQNEEGIVDPTFFGQLLAYFGPFDNNLVRRMIDLLSKPYFFAFCSAERAKDLLIERPNGTFLVRFSLNRWGQVIISVKADGKVSHLVVQNVAGKFRYRQKVDQWWDSIPALIEDHKEALRLSTPQDGGPFVSLFFGTTNVIEGYGYDEGGYDDEE